MCLRSGRDNDILESGFVGGSVGVGLGNGGKGGAAESLLQSPSSPSLQSRGPVSKPSSPPKTPPPPVLKSQIVRRVRCVKVAAAVRMLSWACIQNSCSLVRVEGRIQDIEFPSRTKGHTMHLASSERIKPVL